LKIAILAGMIYYFGVMILVVLAMFLALAWLVSKILPMGLLTGISMQVFSFLLTRRLMGPLPTVPVRHIRVRDSAGQEYLVQMKGQLVSRNASVGDEVVVEGWMRSGTLHFRRGFNKRINAAIRIKAQ